MDNSEWKIDPYNGRRYREVNHIREYEMTVQINGVEIPQSELADFNRRNKEQREAEMKRQRETIINQQPNRTCPFKDGLSTSCHTDCAFYKTGGCKLAVHPGSQTEGKKCPFNNRTCNSMCAMFKNGCTLPAEQ